MSTEPVSRTERKQRTRRALLDAALELVPEQGFSGLSLREVAKRSGIVPTAFYRHFASMDELGIVLVDESMRTLRTAVRAVRENPQGHTDPVRASVRVLYEHVRAHEAHFVFLTRERLGGSGAVRQAVATELRLLTSELAVDLARFDGLRDRSTEDLHTAAGLIVAAMQSTVIDLLEVRPGNREADEHVLRRAEDGLRLVLRGAARRG